LPEAELAPPPAAAAGAGLEFTAPASCEPGTRAWPRRRPGQGLHRGKRTGDTPGEARAIARALLYLAETAERAGPGRAAEAPPAPARARDGERLAGALQLRVERWLEQDGIFTILGFGEVELAGELDWEPGAGPVYLRRLDDGQLWRADVTVTARPAAPGEAGAPLA
jgi:hypothetical protein